MSLIPTTLAMTTLGAKQVGDAVNLEVDMLAKYVERLLAAIAHATRRTGDERALRPVQRPSDDQRPRHPVDRDHRQRVRLHVGDRRSPPQVWAWPVGIVGNILLFAVFVGASVDGAAHAAARTGRTAGLLRRSSASTAGIGGTRTSTAAAKMRPRSRPRWATPSERAAYLGVAAIAVAACAWPLYVIGTAYWDPPWWYFLADSWILVGSILATYAMARGWVDFWLCWIAVDLVGVPSSSTSSATRRPSCTGSTCCSSCTGSSRGARIARAELLAEPEMEAVGL